ncbi:hypothetical protein H6P81_001599 [Aristolochia fimbriata]|uniref:Large ribosomal subunit protein uL4m n=1 Tax=Aristolochia fimbriata TaxID=158543 RepID=A0AAV7FAJ7_ARIFI|nr:hypothetical protein H6P81_001599 [Aristolochia fimbriata]
MAWRGLLSRDVKAIRCLCSDSSLGGGVARGSRDFKYPVNPYAAFVRGFCGVAPNSVKRHGQEAVGAIHDYPATESRLHFLKISPYQFTSRKFSTSILTPEEGAIPPELLSKKKVLTLDRLQGQYEDLVTRVTNFHNEDKGIMVLAGDVFDVPIRKDIVHRVVRWQLAKRQQGTHSTKTISEVSGTGKKPYRQKGTGRARHGTLRGPQFRHGATMHGPKPRSHAIKLQKKVRRLGLKIALSARTAEGKLLVFDDLTVPSHKTKNIVNYISQVENTKKLLLVDGGPVDEKLKLATQNLHYVNVLPSIGLNVYSILQHDTLVMSRDAVNQIVQRMHTPINR